jgi:hypothetical protein
MVRGWGGVGVGLGVIVGVRVAVAVGWGVSVTVTEAVTVVSWSGKLLVVLENPRDVHAAETPANRITRAKGILVVRRLAIGCLMMNRILIANFRGFPSRL